LGFWVHLGFQVVLRNQQTFGYTRDLGFQFQSGLEGGCRPFPTKSSLNMFKSNMISIYPNYRLGIVNLYWLRFDEKNIFVDFMLSILEKKIAPYFFISRKFCCNSTPNECCECVCFTHAPIFC
jgi:hypothetical protein